MASFAEILGNSPIVNSLKAGCAEPNHAYIFAAPKGSGKKLYADAFAKAILCTDKRNGDSCGVCAACRSYDHGNNPDVFRIKPTKTASIGVDDIREQAVREMGTKPYMYAYKIFIIDEAEYGMLPPAQSALLKTLEEPSHYGIFIILTENLNALLPTILSRAAVYSLRPVSDAEAVSFLVKNGVTEARAKFCAVYGQGNIGKALQTAQDEDFTSLREHTLSIVRSLKNKDAAEILLSAKELEKYKDNINEVFDVIIMWLRDLAIFNATENSSLLLQSDLVKEITEDAQEETRAAEKISCVIEAKRRVKANVNFLLTLEIMLLSIGKE